jgi:hypothetical protein
MAYMTDIDPSANDAAVAEHINSIHFGEVEGLNDPPKKLRTISRIKKYLKGEK